LLKEIDEEIKDPNKSNLKDYQKLLNQFETQYVNNNSNVEGIAESLAKLFALRRYQ
jgi:hypothetical protein